MVAWRQANQCAACHHGPMYLWSSHVARRRGYAVDEPQLESYTRWLVADDRARIFPAAEPKPTSAAGAADRMTAAMMGRRNLSQPTLYLAHALRAMPADDRLAAVGRRKLAEHWLSAQGDDGSFAGRMGWPPIFNTPEILTLFAATALGDQLRPATSEAGVEESLAAIGRRAREFLMTQTPDATHQGLVLRLLLETATAGPRQEELLRELRLLQRADGGWSQTADRPSDAFATGQSLYALQRAGVPSTADDVRRCLKFLVESQATDGTWPMMSRVNPETGEPAENLNPITYAAAAWSVIGMASYVPEAPGAR
jgi:N-acyl-D-amino-acid deacylase